MNNIIECASGQLKILAPAKLNLYLSIKGKMSNNYHEIVTVMQTINLVDEIIIQRQPKGIDFECTDTTIKTEDNLGYRAARTILKYANIKEGVNIILYKRIPQAAGLGGGSSDCAAVLLGINKLFNLNIGLSQLCTIAQSLGKDVVYFLYGGLAICEGAGERVTPLHYNPKVWYVLVTFDVKISTKWAYDKYDELVVEEKASLPSALIDAIKKQNIKNIAKNLYNSFEKVLFFYYPYIKELKDILLEAGCLGVSLSGSGATLFGIVKDIKDAEKIVTSFKDKEQIKVDIVQSFYYDPPWKSP